MNWLKNNNKRTTKKLQIRVLNSNMLPSLSAPTLNFLRMRRTWHFEVASLGCLNRKADMLIGLLEKIGHRLLFFSSHENDHTLDLETKRLKASGKDRLNADEWADIQWRCTARSGVAGARYERLRLKTDNFFLEEAEVFSPPTTTSTFELSDSIVVLCRGLAQIWGRPWSDLRASRVFEMDF